MKVIDPFYHFVRTDMQQLIDEDKFWGIEPDYSSVIRTNKFISWIKAVDSKERMRIVSKKTLNHE